MLLGKNTIQEPVSLLQALSSHTEEFIVRNREFTVGVATYNVNGGKHTRSYLDRDNSLSEWINMPEQNPPDLFAIGNNTDNNITLLIILFGYMQWKQLNRTPRE